MGLVRKLSRYGSIYNPKVEKVEKETGEEEKTDEVEAVDKKKKKRENWMPLESNPEAVLNPLIKDLGFDTT